MIPGASAAAVGLLAAVGVSALVVLLTGGTDSTMRRNGKKGLTPKQQVKAERRAAYARKRDEAALVRAARERKKDARLVAIDRSRDTSTTCKRAAARKRRIRAYGKREKEKLEQRLQKALTRAGSRCAASRAATSQARMTLRERREAYDAARGPRAVQLEQLRRSRTADKEQRATTDAIDSALSAGVAPTLVSEASGLWFTKSGRFRAPARAAVRGGSRAKLFERFQEWIGDNENELWARAADRGIPF